MNASVEAHVSATGADAVADNTNTQGMQVTSPTVSVSSVLSDDKQGIMPTPAKMAKEELPDVSEDDQETKGKNSEAALVVPHRQEESREALSPNTERLSGANVHSSKSAEGTTADYIPLASIPKPAEVKQEETPSGASASAVTDPAATEPPVDGPSTCSTCIAYGKPRPAEGNCDKCNINPHVQQM